MKIKNTLDTLDIAQSFVEVDNLYTLEMMVQILETEGCATHCLIAQWHLSNKKGFPRLQDRLSKIILDRGTRLEQVEALESCTSNYAIRHRRMGKEINFFKNLYRHYCL